MRVVIVTFIKLFINYNGVFFWQAEQLQPDCLQIASGNVSYINIVLTQQLEAACLHIASGNFSYINIVLT